MQTTLDQTTPATQTFQDRRRDASAARPEGLPERRQFRDARQYANPDAAELAEAIDRYKLSHRRRFITYEELHDVIVGLGYHKLP